MSPYGNVYGRFLVDAANQIPKQSALGELDFIFFWHHQESRNHFVLGPFRNKCCAQRNGCYVQFEWNNLENMCVLITIVYLLATEPFINDLNEMQLQLDQL